MPLFDKLKKTWNDIKQEANSFPGQHQQAPPQYNIRRDVPPPTPMFVEIRSTRIQIDRQITDHAHSSVPPVASYAQPTEPVKPKVKGEPQLIGVVSDPRLNRDSGCSVRLGSRVLWVYRDTQFTNPDGSVRNLPIICNTASWSDYHPNGQPVLQSIHPQADAFRETALYQYGGPMSDESFFSLKHYDCHPAGNRDDGTRICIWPDTPPIVTHTSSSGQITAYSWIRRSHITNTMGVVVENPAVALYKITYDPAVHTGDILPDVHLVNKSFWPENAIPYGNYGTLLSKDKSTLYLYGQTGGGMHVRTSLARVPVSHIEDPSAYEFWVSNSWTKDRPTINQDGTWLIDCNIGGQGTYFFSELWGCYVWIGGGPFPGPSFHITTALQPEGPWIQPYKFFEARNGSADLGAYSLQAHPDLNADPNDNAVYLTYTKNDNVPGGGTAYSTPLYRVEWE